MAHYDKDALSPEFIMSEPDHSLEEFLFEAAVAKSSTVERDAFLAGVCRGNPALRARLDLLLEGHFGGQAFLTTEPKKIEPRIAQPRDEEEAACNFVGRYKLLEKIGEGGFGEVWMAEQKEPVKRRVALKIIKLGMDTKQVVARFEAERQALALMDHPNIAKVFDGGATTTGRPYFVMELVRGERITEYCDRSQLSTQDRLKLFMQVCHAIQHAHQKGIIHRDLKPSNILVTTQDGVPMTKVIDFGIAKATQQELTDKTVFTQFRQFLGTPAYISPEQAEMSGTDVDTRSDIYSLGVLLYELLTGQTPFDSNQLLAAGLDSLRRIIREVEPDRPSTRLGAMTRQNLTTTAERRGAAPLKLISLVRGDLDWIVMKCLRKEPPRRYESAHGLARDLERYLANEPVTARPPSRVYEFRKTLRRHWVAFAFGAALLAAVAIGFVATSFEAFRARRAETEQSRQRSSAERAETSSKQTLYHSLLNEARATRLARRVGYRDRVFELVRQAMALGVADMNITDLRQEAVACLGDFVGLSPITHSNFATNVASACLDSSGKSAAFALSNGRIEILELRSDKLKASLPCAGVVWGCQFNILGDRLYAVVGPNGGSVSGLTNRWVYTWRCDETGCWSEFGKRAVPGATWDVFADQTGVFNVVLEFEPLGQNGTTKRRLRFRLMDLDAGAFVAGCEVLNEGGRNFAFAASPGGQFLALANSDDEHKDSSGIIRVFDWRSGEWTNQLHLPASGRVCVSDEGKYLCCLSPAGTEMYQLPNFELIGQFKEFSGSWATFSRNLKVALPLTYQNRIRLWSLASHEDIAVLDEPESSRPVAFSCAGDYLLSIGPRHARLYSMKTSETLELTPHAGAVTGLAFSPDGSVVASVGQDQVLRAHDVVTGDILWHRSSLPGSSQNLDFSPDGRWLVCAGASPAVWILDARTGKHMLTLQNDTWPKLDPVPAPTIRFSPDGRYLAEARGRGGIQIWAIENWKLGEETGLEAKSYKSWTNGHYLVFAPDGESVAFCAQDEGKHILNLWEFNRSSEPRPMSPSIWCGMPAFTLDGAQLLAKDTGGAILTLDPKTGERLSSFQAESTTPPLEARADSFLRLSPDGLKLAAQSASGFGVNIWERATGHLLYHLGPDIGNIHCLAWSPDSRHMAIGRDNGSIVLWDLAQVDTTLVRLGLNP